jgi:AraC-like DNA-binding protein
MTSLITGYLRGLCSLDAPLPDAQSAVAEEAAVSLLSSALRSAAPDGVADTAVLMVGLRQRILEFVADNIYSSELSPDFLCRRFNVSRAHLYRAFAREGGVAKVLRDTRLDAAHHELTQNIAAPRSITEIAYSLGFSSSNQLLRSFRTRFGVTPSSARAGGRGINDIHVAEPSQQNVDLHMHFARLSGKVRP